MSGTSGPSLPVPFGFYDPDTRSLRTSRTTFESASTLSCATLPTSGSMLSGALYARTRSALPTSDGVSSSSPRLPTPTARDWKGEGYEGQLPNSVALLKTPTAQLAINGGSQHPDKRKAGRHGPTLADEVEHLLPTPNASDAKGSGATQGRTRKGRPRPLSDADLPEVVKLLPTPRASDGEKGGPNQRGSKGDLALPSAVVQLLPTPRVAAGRTGRSAIERSSSSPSLEQAVELANGETPRELENLEKVPPSWSGGSSPRRSRGGKRRPAAVPPGQLTIEAD